MEKKKVFTDDSIAKFCRITGDSNKIHDPNFMRKNGVLPVVPGMLTLAYAASSAEDFLRESDHINVYFGLPLYSRDIVEIGSGEEVPILKYEDLPLEKRIFAKKNGRDALSLDGCNSKLFKTQQEMYPSFEGPLSVSYPINKEDIDEFELFIAAEENVAGFLFAVAYSSHVLLDAIKKPERPEGETVFFDDDQLKCLNGNGQLPVYTRLEFSFFNGFAPLDTSATLDFRVGGKKERGKRDYTFKITCEQNNNILYNGVYKLKSMTDRLIIRNAKKLLRND